VRRAVLGAAVASALALVWALAPGVGSADTPGLTASLPPYDYTGFQSHLILNDVGPAGGLPANHVPGSISILLAQGFGFDPQAVSATCSPAQAQGDPNNNACPTASRIGRGTIDVTISGLISGNDQAQITLFEMPPQASGDIAGVAFYFFINDAKNQFMFQGTSIGHLRPVSGDPQFGSTIAIDKLQFPTIPPGINITLNDMKLDLGAPDLSASMFAGSSASGTAPVKHRHRHHRKHKKHKKHPRKKTHGRRATAGQAKLIAKPVAHSLLTNPASCGGSWPIRVSWGYSDGTRSADAAAACAAAPPS
jgi:hypothetical protein